MAEPFYWRYETSGALRPAVEAYLAGAELSAAQIAVLRNYLRQWIMAPVWRGDAVVALRESIELIETREAIDAWLAVAQGAGIDPL